jgi:hypothetical protein
LPVLIEFSTNGEAHVLWRRQLESGGFPVEFELFRSAATEGIDDGYVQLVLDQNPVEIPGFIEKGPNKTMQATPNGAPDG